MMICLKLLCLYILSCNWQNTGLLEVLTEVLQTFNLCYYSPCLTTRETGSVTKISEQSTSSQPLQYTLSTSEPFHGLHVPNPPFVCQASPCNSEPLICCIWVTLHGGWASPRLMPSGACTGAHRPAPSSWAPSPWEAAAVPAACQPHQRCPRCIRPLASPLGRSWLKYRCYTPVCLSSIF